MKYRAFILAAPLLAAIGSAFADPATMPLLGDSDIHLYTVFAYEPFDEPTTQAVEGRYEELIASGMDTARHLFDWRDLEPAVGQYATDFVIEEMDALRDKGIAHQFPNLVILDSEGTVVPDYIQNLINGGTPWGDPQITGAFANLLDVFVPIMLERGMYMLGLSNEPGSYYEDNPARAESFKDFVQAAVSHAHSIEPDLSCTVVFAGAHDRAIADLMPLLDVASFNSYIYKTQLSFRCRYFGFPLSLYRADSADHVDRYLDDLIEAADGKLINIQEIGQASEGETLGRLVSERNQAEVYAALAYGLEARKEYFRTVCNWSLNDYDKLWLVLRELLIREGLPECYANNIFDVFTKTGLVYSDHTATLKPAFKVFKRAVEYFSGDDADVGSIEMTGLSN